ncbi:glucose inhibited division protein a homologue, putative [Plasmodium malariae]|uniref:Glucose inhibited division protein a homologue, putative n=1 Tax=Plasmodium malariae TaxID=5858 RepID=A0A1C3L3E1_PLAMA|nr:glucose inhibited division protein a homologue, putative [Plasmodium malariae]
MFIIRLCNSGNIKTLFYVIIFSVHVLLISDSYHLKTKQLFLRPSNDAKRALVLKLLNNKCNCKYVDKEYDVIVIGGGHSGCEASHISAKMNAKTLLITQSKKSIGEMSCNPSIGGIGKGILVKEIDALGGLMGKVIDKSGIHFKILNIRKGLAVRGHRAQADRDLYNYYMKEYLFNMPNLYILENTVHALLLENTPGGAGGISGSHRRGNAETGYYHDQAKKVYGVKNKCNCEFYADNIILTTGTFLGGVCHIGKEKYYGGRIKRISSNMSKNEIGIRLESSAQTNDTTLDNWAMDNTKTQESARNNQVEKNMFNEGNFTFASSSIEDNNGNIPFDNLIEASSENISNQLRENKFEIKRMKTGTPPRLDKNSINFDILEKERTEEKNPFYFSFLNSNKINNNQTLPCYKTYTNSKTHDLVRKNLNELPYFDTYDKLGNGPRYCPSIAKKVTKFAEKKKHLIWLEPEGLNDNLIYPNGLSSAFPLHIQKEIINSIKGLEQAKIIFPAYDVEYYYVNPKCLNYTLETKNIKGLFLSGQICGTTGYEEAACQGIIAGINAALNTINKKKSTYKSFILKRSDSYIGVLIHDLINKGITEPYRIFTSRAEYRLYLRPDNCDIRLTPKADKLGIISPERIYILKQKYSSVKKLIYIFRKLILCDDRLSGNAGDEVVGAVRQDMRQVDGQNVRQEKGQEVRQEGRQGEELNKDHIEYNNTVNSFHVDFSEHFKVDSSSTVSGSNIHDNVKHDGNYTQRGNTIIDKNKTEVTKGLRKSSSKDTSLPYSKGDIHLQLTFPKKKKNMNTLYNIIKGGAEYPLDVLLHKLKDIQNLSEYKDMLLSYDEQINLNIYSNDHDYDLSIFNCEDTLINSATLETACAEVKYSHYLKKQIQEIHKIKDNFNLAIPSNIKYDRLTFILTFPTISDLRRHNFPYLSNEEIEKLNKFKPRTLYDANNIEGVTMSAIYYLYHYIRNGKNKIKN